MLKLAACATAVLEMAQLVWSPAIAKGVILCKICNGSTLLAGWTFMMTDVTLSCTVGGHMNVPNNEIVHEVIDLVLTTYLLRRAYRQ